MTEPIVSSRPRAIVVSAGVCAFIALYLIVTVAQSWVFRGPLAGGALAIASITFGIGIVGLSSACLLLTLSRLALPTFAAFWLSLVVGACYSWAFLKGSRDYRGALAIAFLICCAAALWRAIHRSWPSNGARSNNRLQRTGEG
jgi:hypothetical protein